MSNRIPGMKKRKKKSNGNRKARTPLHKSECKYAVYQMNDTAQMPTKLGGALLLKGTRALLPRSLAQADITSNATALEDLFIKVQPGMDLTNKNVLIIRNGGIGDILASLFGIVELKRKFKNIHIGYLAEYKNLQFIDGFKGIIDFPAVNTIPYDKLKHFTHMVYLDDLVETRNDLSVHDLFAEAMNVKIYPATLDTLHKYFNISKFERNGIGIQYRSNAVIRNYNFDHVVRLINLITEKYPGMPIHLLGVPDDFLFVNYAQVNSDAKIHANGCGFPSYSVLDAFNIIQRLQVVVACDSSMTHIAGLCDTPLIGLFGPFHSDKRLLYYNNTVGINGKTQCSPCNRHDPQSFCPYTNGEGVCLNSITPELIMENIDKLIGTQNDS